LVGRENMLILHRDGETRELLAAILRSRNCEVVPLASADAVHDALERASHDLAIVEASMLESGELRQSLNQLAIIVLCHGLRRPHDTQRFIHELGLRVRVIQEPFYPREVVSHVQDLVASTSATKEVPSLQLLVSASSSSPERLDRKHTTTSATRTDAVRARFAELRAAYAAKLEGKIKELRSALDAARAERSQREQAGALAHRLRGTAGSYGFRHVSEHAAVIDEALKANGPKAPASDTWRRIDEAMAALEAEPRPSTPPPAVTTSETNTLSLVPTHGISDAHTHAPNLLLVCDDSSFLKQVEIASRRSLVGLHLAQSSKQALEMAQRHAPDAALIDLSFGDGQSAVEIARKLRARLSSLPLAFVSADGALSARIAATHAGAALFLTKPLGDHEIVDAMRQLCGPQHAERPRLLVVDDDPDFVEGLAALLSDEQLEVHTLIDPRKIVETLDEVRPDLLMLDVMLPVVNGFELCRIVRANPKWQMLPVLMLTALASEDTRMRSFEAGADDYLLKPIVKQELLARLRLRLDHARLVRERSSKDSLTGALTRQAFMEAFAARLAESQRHHGVLSLCLFDLDRFKWINDTHGHLAGDRVLAALGRILTSRFRDCDIRGRWGGEEFVVAFRGVDCHATAEILCRLQRELREIVFIGDSGQAFNATFSAGISTHPDDGPTLEELIKVADRRLYQAKRAGRDRIQLSDDGPPMTNAVSKIS